MSTSRMKVPLVYLELNFDPLGGGGHYSDSRLNEKGRKKGFTFCLPFVLLSVRLVFIRTLTILGI